MAGWSAFFQVQAGVSASLLGLVFVGLSISLSRIIASRHLPNRALEALLVLLLNLTLASLCLVPRQGSIALAIEILALAGATWISVTLLHIDTFRFVERGRRRRVVIATLLGQGVFAAWIVGGAAVLIQGVSGLGYLAPSFLLGYLLAILNAWVLLVEIHR